MKKSTFFLLAKLFALSFGVLFFVSPDSYTHDTFGHMDTAWFFTCGKAWMNGMIPYVDFADSKGPLLWLIYGIGYLISSFDYIGVFWLSVLLYTAVFYYVYLIANLFLRNDKVSFLAVVCMTVSYFCPWFHHEIRAEDWCQFFIAMTFYYCCRWLYKEQRNHSMDCYTACFVLGISLAGTLLIKYTITAMLGIVASYMLYAIIREKENLLYSLLSFLSGFVLMMAPFVIYMLCVGCFDAFIQEYFLNTLQTVSSSNTADIYLHEWLMLVYVPQILVLFLLCCTGAYMMAKIVKIYKLFFLISFIGFYSISIHHYIYHYLSSCLFFPLFLIISFIVKHSHSLRIHMAIQLILLFVVVLFNSYGSSGFLLKSWFFNDNSDRTDFNNIAYIMSGIKNPTIVHYMTIELGQGLKVGALPGAKYWAFQLGATPEMKKNQETAIKNQQTDFVVISDYLPGIEKREKFVLSSGYHLVYECHNWSFQVYSKYKELPIPPVDFHVSNIDVLFKRNVFKH